MKVVLAVLAVTWCRFIEIQGEPDYHLPPSNRARQVIVNYDIPPPPPPSGGFNHHHHHNPYHGQFSKVLSFNAPDFGDDEYGSAQLQASPAPSPPLSNFKQEVRFSHPNSLQSSEGEDPKGGFEVLRAPVIYHETVTDKDTDVTKALSNAFGVVQTLRKPGQSKPEEFQNFKSLTKFQLIDALPQSFRQSQGGKSGGSTTTTTTIVDIPSQVNFLPSAVSSTAPVIAQSVQNFAPLPPAADLPPAPITVLATSSPPVIAKVISNPEPIITPTKSSFTTPVIAQKGPSPKLIIPSQPHVTTLEQAVQGGDPQVRTIIQPVYIPYAVDQNGQPVGPLPDYQSMDFGAILSAQNQLLTVPTASPGEVVSTVPSAQVQVVEQSLEPQQYGHQQQQQQPQYYIQPDQTVQAASLSESSPTAAPEDFGKRIVGIKRGSTRTRL